MKRRGNSRKMPGSVLVAGLAALCGVLLVAGEAGAQAVKQGEYEIKAAFLFNFIKFVEWPAALGPKAGSPYIVGLAGDGSFAGRMAGVLKGKAVCGHGIEVRVLGEKDGAAVPRECHVVFVSGNDEESVAGTLAAVRGAAVLTVGEVAGFAGAGGMIGFKIIDDNMRFEINNAAAKDAGLTISSKLLKLATLVITKPAVK